MNEGDAVFAVLLALLSTSLLYRFGIGGQVEQLPIILRQLDPNYLTNDAYVASSVEFGPRWYFAQFVAWVGRALPLPWALLTLRFLLDLTLVAVTQWTSRHVIGADRLGSRIAAVLTVSVSSFHLGDATNLRYVEVNPAGPGIVGMLVALALAFRGRPISAAIVASIASLSHPLYGIEGGTIALGTALFVLVAPPGASVRAWPTALLQTAIGGAVLATAFVAFWWWPYQRVSAGVSLPAAEWFEILARFRVPHHYLPSHFRPRDYVTTGLFVIATWLAFSQWRRTATSVRLTVVVPPVLAVLAACAAGVLFTDVWAVRGVTTLQLFRLLSIVKWIGYLLMGAVLAHYWQQPPCPLARPLTGLSLLSTTGTYPLVTTIVLLLLRFRHRVSSAVSPRLVTALMVLAAGVLWTGVLWTYPGSRNEAIHLVAALALTAACSQPRRTLRIAGGLATVAFVLVVAGNRGGRVVDVGALTPVFSAADLRDVEAETARAAARHTRADALFVAPPNFGVLRIVGERALVVDFEAIPFQDKALREWRARLRVVYGDVNGGGPTALRALEDAYRATTDAHLQDLARRYGATHAVLYATTPTAFPELYANGTYRVVQLSR